MPGVARRTKNIKQDEADERTRIILDASSRIIILFDSNFKVVYCNPAAYKLMGFESKEDLIARFVEHVKKNTPEFQTDGVPSVSIADRLKTAYADGHSRFEAELHVDGATRIFDVEMKKVPYENSFALVVYIFDKTDMREREQELLRVREQNELQLAKLNLVVQATKIGLWDMEVVKEDPVNPGNAFRWSGEFRQMLGYGDEDDFPDLLSSWSKCIHPDDEEMVIETFERHILDTTGKTPYDVEYRMIKKNGECGYFRDCGETIRNKDGEPIRVAGALMDITKTQNILQDTERQRIEAEAANKAKSSFLSTMSHEIRTPLNAILGITEIQLQRDSIEPDVREAFDRIYASGDLLLGIINDILDLSKIEAGRLELSEAKYEIASLISDTAQLNMLRIGSKQIEFEINADENTPAFLFGDGLRIKQILNNLLSNAFKYTEKGMVKLSLSTESSGENDDQVTLIFSVSDTGQGMSREQIRTLFDQYVRFNSEVNRATEGTGLGMNITQNLIQLMGGEITVESEQGKGSAFTVRLPQSRIGTEALGREAATNLREFRTSGMTRMKRASITREQMPYGSVLIVDDVETNIYVARGLMAPYGLKIDSASSGFEAIEKIKSGNVYDIVFMDHMMPKMDGVEATGKIRAAGYKNPIVALTANAVAGQMDVFLKNGFDDFISKPIDLRQLNNVLNRLIRDKQPAGPGGSAHPQGPGANERFARAFLRDATRVIGVLEAISEKDSYNHEGDVRTYAINVHGIKSALANMGNDNLAAAAAHLEAAVRERRLETIRSDTPVFIKALRSYAEELAALMKV